jgi:hypothetical protein
MNILTKKRHYKSLTLMRVRLTLPETRVSLVVYKMIQGAWAGVPMLDRAVVAIAINLA